MRYTYILNGVTVGGRCFERWCTSIKEIDWCIDWFGLVKYNIIRVLCPGCRQKLYSINENSLVYDINDNVMPGFKVAIPKTLKKMVEKRTNNEH